MKEGPQRSLFLLYIVVPFRHERNQRSSYCSGLVRCILQSCKSKERISLTLHAEVWIHDRLRRYARCTHMESIREG
jgi:hypothetical protein